MVTNVAFTITDPRQEGNPLIWASPAFAQMTGYRLEESIGRNCRFLQGPATDPDATATLRRHLAAREAVTVVLLNYRKDGTPFWNELSISPIFDRAGGLLSFVGVQVDVTERIRADLEQDRARQAEQVARQRLSLLAEATGALISTLDGRDALGRLAELVVPDLGDWVVFILADDAGELSDVVVRHRDGRKAEVDAFAERLPAALGGRSLLRGVLDGGDPTMVAHLDEEKVRGFLTDPEAIDACTRFGLTSAIYVPLLARRNRVLGALAFVSGPSGRVWDASDLEVAADLGRRAGLSIDNARLYQQEHLAAETLQRSLLPKIPSVDGLTISTRYLSANSAVEVGGDFYEVTPLPDGSVGIAVGDVVGHDLTAAAAMGHLRVLLRSIAWDRAQSRGAADPADVLDRADELVQALGITSMATVLFARLRRIAEPGTTWVLTYCNAGHPPALLRRPDGGVELVGTDGDVLLGAVGGVKRTSTDVMVASGTMLIAFTDGLVEVPGGNLDDSLASLACQVSALGPDAGPEEVAEGLTAAVSGERRDDIALLVICID